MNEENFKKNLESNANFLHQHILTIHRNPSSIQDLEINDHDLKNRISRILLQSMYPSIESHDLDYMVGLFSVFMEEAKTKYLHMNGVLFDLALYVLGKASFLEYLSQKSEWLNDHLNEMTLLALKYQSPITKRALIWAIVMQNREMLQVLRHSKKLPVLSDEDKCEVLVKLGESQNPYFLELFINEGLIHVQDVFLTGVGIKNTPFSEMIQKRETFALQKLFELGLKFPDFEIAKEMVDLAIQEYYLDQAVLLHKEMKIQYPDKASFFPEIFSEDASIEETEDRLIQFALGSSLRVLQEVIDTYHSDFKKALLDLLEKAIPVMAIQARLPKFQADETRKGSLEDVKSFTQKNQVLLTDLVLKLPDLSWQQFIAFCVERRKDDPKEPKGVDVLRWEGDTPLHTTIGSFLRNQCNEFLILDKYSHGWQKAAAIKQEIPEDSDLVTKGPRKILSFFYQLPDGNKICMNQFFNGQDMMLMSLPAQWYWQHATTESIKATDERMNELHRQAVDFDFTQKTKKEFDQVVAEVYWLATTRVETARGSAHNAKLWLLAVHHFHNLPMPIVKLEYFFLDSIMTSVTVNEAKQLWPTFFED